LQVAKSAVALCFFALAIWLCVSSIATETKPGGATQDSNGIWKFEKTTFGDDKKSAKGKPTSQSTQSPSPSPSPQKKGCEQKKREKDDQCRKFESMKQEYHQKCEGDHYSAGECEVMGPGLVEMEKACNVAKCALAKCQGKKCDSESSPTPAETPSAPDCHALSEVANTVCFNARRFVCNCSGDQYSKHREWCDKERLGDSVQAWAAARRNDCQQVVKELKQACPGQTSHWINEPCAGSELQAP